MRYGAGMKYEKIDLENYVSEIEQDVRSKRCIGRPLVNLSVSHISQRVFFIPADKADLVKALFDFSLSKQISHVNRVLSDSPEGFLSHGRIYGYEVNLVESPDGTTNITPEFISMWDSDF